MFSWRITKYDPNNRDDRGRYTQEDWISVSDIGSVFDGKRLTTDDYLKIEDAYVAAIQVIMRCNHLFTLKVVGLEIYREEQLTHNLLNDDMINLWYSINDGDILRSNQVECASRLILREHMWAKLEYDNKMFVHFGYDYYMFIGSSKECNKALMRIIQSGLFVEPFISPYSYLE